jgi:hypothetical protein
MSQKNEGVEWAEKSTTAVLDADNGKSERQKTRQ